MHYPCTFGHRYSKEKTTFTLWAPSSIAVELWLYDAGSSDEIPYNRARHAMKPGEEGVFTAEVDGDLHGVYYNFLLTDAKGRQTFSEDPWATAAGVNGRRSMVVDMERTNPEGWLHDRRVNCTAAPVIWETHVRDFSSSVHSGIPELWRGKYMGFTVTDSTVDGEGKYATCLNYLQKLGITHVQLQPIAEIASIDERRKNDYNWGYDIQNYNVPEGSYATDPYHGEVRIRECKAMIQALHNAGIGVVLDVVYNHTYHRHSALDRTAPGEYYREAADGSPLNASGCGNETASDRAPFRNYMLQSILYWVKEYHVDGFRFDLMGVHDVDTMNYIRKELDALPEGEKILMLGEPWSALPTGIKAPQKPVSWGTMGLLSPRIAAFSDRTRNAVAGENFDPGAKGYAGGNVNDDVRRQIKSAVAGLCRKDLDPLAAMPSQVVHYASCHDNFALWDRLVIQGGTRDFDEPHPELIPQMRLISGIIMTCAGIAFLQSGEEFCRTKHGDGNSYQGPDSVNQLDWSLVKKHHDLVKWYRGLLGLRREFMPELTDSAFKGIEFLEPPAWECVAFSKAVRKGSRFARFLVCYNPTDQPVALPVPEGMWTLLCDATQSTYWELADTQAESPCMIAPCSMVILGQ